VSSFQFQSVFSPMRLDNVGIQSLPGMMKQLESLRIETGANPKFLGVLLNQSDGSEPSELEGYTLLKTRIQSLKLRNSNGDDIACLIDHGSRERFERLAKELLVT
jgi:hypothetical protein